MTDYPFEGQLIADPVTFQRATNADVMVYDGNDTTNSTPLALKDARVFRWLTRSSPARTLSRSRFTRHRLISSWSAPV